WKQFPMLFTDYCRFPSPESSISVHQYRNAVQGGSGARGEIGCGGGVVKSEMALASAPVLADDQGPRRLSRALPCRGAEGAQMAEGYHDDLAYIHDVGF